MVFGVVDHWGPEVPSTLASALVLSRTWWLKLHCWRHHIFKLENVEKSAWKLHPRWVDVSARRSSAWCYRRKAIIRLPQLWTQRTTMAASLARHFYWCRSRMHGMGTPTTFWLDIRPAPQVKTHAWPHYRGQEPVVRQITNPGGKPIAIVLLNCHRVKVIPKDYRLRHLSALFKEYLLQQMVAQLVWEQGIRDHGIVSYKWTSLLHISSQVSEIIV